MSSTALQVTNATKARKPKTVLHDVSLRADAGQRIALLGPNGAGKPTLMKAILGLTTYDAGQITVAGHGPGIAAARAATAYLPEAVFSQSPEKQRATHAVCAAVRDKRKTGCRHTGSHRSG